MTHGELQGLWQRQPPEPFEMSVEDVRRKAGTFERTIAWRNMREYAAALAAAAWFAVIGWRASDSAARIGAGLVVAGLCYVVVQLAQRGSARRVPAELGRTGGAAFLTHELARQRDLLRGVWRWYLGPPIPGMAILLFGAAREGAARGGPAAWPIAAGAAALVALVFVAIARANTRAASRLQRQIDALTPNGDR